MRELSLEETKSISGAVINVASGAVGAVLGGLGNGVGYLLSSEHPSTSGFMAQTAVGAVSGFLIGSGGELLVLAFQGVRGAATVGTVAVGVGATVQATAGAVQREDRGGSE